MNHKLIKFGTFCFGIVVSSLPLLNLPLRAQTISSVVCLIDEEEDTYSTIVTLSKLNTSSRELIINKAKSSRGECTILRLGKTFIVILPTSSVRFANQQEIQYRKDNFVPPAEIKTPKPRFTKPRLE